MRLYRSNVTERADDLVSVYAEVFTAPPWNEPADAAPAFRKRLDADRHRPGFRAAVAPARDGGPGAEGFATGWTTPDPFPADRSYARIAAQLGPRLGPLLVGAFEVDEMAVRSSARGTGLGRSLLAALCDGAAPDGRAWLLTARSAPDAVAFYRRLGWHEVLPVPGADPGDLVAFLAPGHPGAAAITP
ncbi:N-acetyltransferase [Streptomyces spiroverticillatus]|uniref:N-acetyltransferase n=1 Tax=Streptomyces finlayi TaxID=67296 RepID=A0A918WYS1_9ACTN|nr:N-acetyltransferase [Streptomyces spiroverticillatus]GHC96502.1 N-acetyltransferase [Streptomyces finlayi]